MAAVSLEVPLDDLAILALGGRSGQAAEPARAVEIRDAGTLDENLLDIASGNEVRQRAEVGDRAQHAIDHPAGVAERHLVAEVGAPLVVVDGSMYFTADLIEIAFGTQAALLNSREHVAADGAVRIAGCGHRAPTVRRRREPSRPARVEPLPDGAPSTVARPANAFVKGPDATRSPAQV